MIKILNIEISAEIAAYKRTASPYKGLAFVFILPYCLIAFDTRKYLLYPNKQLALSHHNKHFILRKI